MSLRENSNKRVVFPRKKDFVIGILLAGFMALPFFLNQFVWVKLKHDLPFKFDGESCSFLPGSLSVRNFRFKTHSVSEASAKLLEVHYNPWDFLLTQKLRLDILSKGISIKPPELFSKKESTPFKFDSLKVLLELDIQGKIQIAYFCATGHDLVVYIGGGLSKEKLDITLSCFLTSELLTKLPPFVSEHLFYKEDTLLKQIRLRAEGTWDQPFFYLSSDLVKIEFKSRGPGS